MRATRREFLGFGSGLVCSSALAEGPAGNASAAPAEERIRCLDYGRSFLCHKGETAVSNAVRFWIESRTTLLDDRGKATHEFYQCASCKSEHTFAPKNLFIADNYDFLPIFGSGRVLVFRRTARLNPGYRTIRKVEEMWGVPILKLHPADPLTELDSWEKVRDATAAGLPLVTQTEITSAETGLRAIIECPAKTINIEPKRKLYQVDTGPVAYPDLAKVYDPPIDGLRLAFIAFNAPHFVDFVVEQPTPVVEDGKELCKIHHYSGPFSVPAKNVVLAVGKLP
jgi:hypothetical protein